MAGLGNILIFCPDLTGHRHLYVRRIVEYLAERGFGVICAGGGRILEVGSFGRCEYAPFDDPAVDFLRKSSKSRYIDLLPRLKSWIELDLCVEIAQENSCRQIIHVDGDFFLPEFSLGILPDAIHEFRNHLVILNTEGRDVQDNTPLWKEALRLLKNIVRLPRAVNIIRFRGAFVDCYPRISQWLLKKVVSKASVSSIWHCDERYSNFFGRKSICVPEIGIGTWEEQGDAPPPLPEFESGVLLKIQEFCDSMAGEIPIFCLGDLEQRKGFDLILSLCNQNKNLICIRVGRTKPGYSQEWKVIEYKEKLLREGRLLEIDCYVEPALFRRLILMSRVMVLPYRNFYRTSAMFMDVLSCKKPVLVPSKGLMGFTVQQHGLGETFEHGDPKSLFSAFEKLYSDPGAYQSNLEKFAKNLTKESIYKVWDQAVLPGAYCGSA